MFSIRHKLTKRFLANIKAKMRVKDSLIDIDNLFTILAGIHGKLLAATCAINTFEIQPAKSLKDPQKRKPRQSFSGTRLGEIS